MARFPPPVAAQLELTLEEGREPMKHNAPHSQTSKPVQKYAVVDGIESHHEGP